MKKPAIMKKSENFEDFAEEMQATVSALGHPPRFISARF
jgi:hypothetical protein